MKDIGHKIKMLRVMKQKKQREIAVILNLSIPAYSKIENGKTDINTARLQQISAYFEVTPAWFFEEHTEIDRKKQDHEIEIRKLEKMISELRDKLVRCMEQKIKWAD